MTTTIITGAGAVIDWGGPKTNELTDILREDKTFRTKSGVTVGEFLYQILQKKSLSADTNFEHIINSVELIYNHVKTDKLNLDSSAVLHLNCEVETELLSFAETYEECRGYYYPIRGNTEFCFQDNQGYLKQIHRHFLRLISLRVSKYEQTVAIHNKLNARFKKFIQQFSGGILRYYTTNYDRLPILATNLEFFEGFTSNANAKQVFDPIEISFKKQTNCYYNLHGSIHYDNQGFQILHKPEKVSTEVAVFLKDSGQDGSELLPSNIITGMNKASRILFPPHIQFYNSLYNDCLRADQLVIIGYSFSDVHINQAIKSALKTRFNIKVFIIDYFDPKADNKGLFSKINGSGFNFNYWPTKGIKFHRASEGLPHFIFWGGLKKILQEDTSLTSIH